MDAVDIISRELTSSQVFRHTIIYGGAAKTPRVAELIARVTCSRLRPFDVGWDTDRITQELLALPCDGYTSDGLRTTDATTYVLFVDNAHLVPVWEAWMGPLAKCETTHNGGLSWLPYFTIIASVPKSSDIPRELASLCPIHLGLDDKTADDAIELLEYTKPKRMPATAVGNANPGLSTLDGIVTVLQQKPAKPISPKTRETQCTCLVCGHVWHYDLSDSFKSISNAADNIAKALVTPLFFFAALVPNKPVADLHRCPHCGSRNTASRAA